MLLKFIALTLLCATCAFGIKIHQMHCISEIQARFAITDFLSSIENDNPWGQEEAIFEMFLPERAFISSFSMEMDGITTVGTIEREEVARQKYEQARINQQAGTHIEQDDFNLPRNTKKFLIKVNVPKGKRVDFNCTYQEVLKREHGVYKHVINIIPRTPVQQIEVDVLVAEKSPFRLLQNGRKVHVPQFRPDVGYLENDNILNMPLANDVEIRDTQQATGSLAYIYYKPNTQRTSGQLAVLFDIVRDQNAGTIQTYDGYFLQSIVPEQLPTGPKHVIFVIDKSGSMKGNKMKQVKKAMHTILKEMNSQDYFDVMLFSTATQVWSPNLTPANPGNIQSAQQFVDASEAKGGTNIEASIREALDILGRSNAGNPLTKMIIFLTDGKATVGQTNQQALLNSINQANNFKDYSIHCIGFGNNADMPLLQQISSSNDGLARRVMADADADVQLEGIYQQLQSPKLRNINIQYVNGGADVGSLVRPDDGNMFFDGGEVVQVGKLSNPAGLQFDSVVTGDGANGRASIKQTTYKGANAECYPDPSSEPKLFTRNDGSSPPKPRYLITCGSKPAQPRPSAPLRPSGGSSSNTGSGSNTGSSSNTGSTGGGSTSTSTNARPFPGRNRGRLNSWLERLGGDLGGRLSSIFGSNSRGKRQVEGSGDGPARPVGAANSIGGFIERMWAYLTIRNLEEKAELWTTPQHEKNAAKERAISLALKYGFVTKHTSMVVVHNQVSQVPNELEDAPRQNNQANPLEAGSDQSRGSNRAGQRGPGGAPSINIPQPGGECDVGLILVIDQRSRFQLQQRSNLVHQLVDTARKDFTGTQFQVVQLQDDGSMIVRLKEDQDQSPANVRNAIDAAIRGDACPGCPSGPQAQGHFARYLFRSGAGFQKSFLVFTGESDLLDNAFGRFIKRLFMPRIMVPTHNARFSPAKEAQLSEITTENQILYSFDTSDLSVITDLVGC